MGNIIGNAMGVVTKIVVFGLLLTAVRVRPFTNGVIDKFNPTKSVVVNIQEKLRIIDSLKQAITPASKSQVVKKIGVGIVWKQSPGNYYKDYLR